MLIIPRLRKQCVQMVPSRFEIGPVYSTNPRARKSLRTASAFRPLAKELVFDIDMTDYDDIRTCCSGANICNRCWSFITMSIKVVDTSLREDFGFKHILWVYSGRRGAHAWVCDKRAREMDDQKRKAVAGYLELLRGGDSSGKRVNIKRPLHPHLEYVFNVLRLPSNLGRHNSLSNVTLVDAVSSFCGIPSRPPSSGSKTPGQKTPHTSSPSSPTKPSPPR